MKTRSYNKLDLDLQAAESQLSLVIINNGTMTPDYLYRKTHQSGCLVGGYNNLGANSLKSSPIYTIGSGYLPNEETLGNMYGIGYSHTNSTFVGAQAGDGWGMYVASDGNCRIFLNGSNGIAYLTATSANYADVAEKYLGDKVYPAGTVLAIGGDNEVTEYTGRLPVAGVVSTNPALIMNDTPESANELYCAVALKGKIPCFVEGVVKKGQYVVAYRGGKGIASDKYIPEFHIGVALEDSVEGTVMVKV